MIYARLGDGKSEGYFRSYWNSYTMKHEENEKLDRIYALLVKLGYEMSDDERRSRTEHMSFSGRRPTNESIYLQRLRCGYRLDQNTQREVHAV